VWRDFCRALEAAGDVVLRPGSPSDVFDRAEGWRYLSRLARVALEQFVECADPEAPVFRRPSHETVKIGADNPDNTYLSAAIRGDLEYRITGSRGSVHYLGIGTYAGQYGGSGRRGQTGYIEGRDLALGPNGELEISVARERRPGNWLPMESDSSLLIVRQTFRERAREQVAQLRIERVGAVGAPAPLTPAALDTGLAHAARFVHGTASLFADWAEGFAKRPNALPPFDPSVAAAAHGDPNIQYYHGYWQLAEDEALVIELNPPACDYWNFQLNNHWMESLDYRYHRIAINHAEASAEHDGSIRLVVAARNPGVANWLDTASHVRGTMCLRYVGAGPSLGESDPRHPCTRRVKLNELARR
jgi:hypothetical protein